jgi:hypothetical protein
LRLAALLGLLVDELEVVFDVLEPAGLVAVPEGLEPPPVLLVCVPERALPVGVVELPTGVDTVTDESVPVAGAEDVVESVPTSVAVDESTDEGEVTVAGTEDVEDGSESVMDVDVVVSVLPLHEKRP